jgi:hypothetical protein
MKNKYYTPELEEFHVGFEYETTDIMDNGEWGWRKQVFEGEEMRTWFTDELNKGQHRVKYLDREDIESLGWEEDKSNSEPDRLNLEFIKNEYTYGIVLYNIMQVVIYKYKYKFKEEILFEGKIKNKSELKRLMKQLNIK